MTSEVRFAQPDVVELFNAQNEAFATHDRGGFGVGYIALNETSPEGHVGRLVFVNPFLQGDQATVWTPTYAPKDDVETVADRIYPIPEAYFLMGRLAAAYSTRNMQLIEGPSSIGKTYLLGQFSQMVQGLNLLPLRIMFHGQSDGSGVFASYAPRTSVDDEESSPSSWLMRDGVVTLGMGSVVPLDDAGMNIDMFPEGGIVNLDEIGQAPPPVANMILGLRGDRGEVAEQIPLLDLGRLLRRGRKTHVVMTTNSPGAGHPGVSAINPALLRGTDHVVMPELSPESLKTVARRTLLDAAASLAELSYGVDISKNQEMLGILSEVMTSIHIVFSEIIKGGSRSDAQRIIPSIDDMHRVAKHLQMQQMISRQTFKPDVAQTLKVALGMFYADRISDENKKRVLLSAVHTVLYDDRPGETAEEARSRREQQQQGSGGLEIGKHTRAERINQLATDLYGEDDHSAQGDFQKLEIVLGTLQKLALHGGVFDPPHLAQFLTLQADIKALLESNVADVGRLAELQAEALSLVESLGIGEFAVGKLRQLDRMNPVQQTKVYALKGGRFIAAGSGDEVYLFPGYEQDKRIRLSNGIVKDIDVMGPEVYILESGTAGDKVQRYNAETAEPLEPIDGFEVEIKEVHVDDTTGTVVVVDAFNNSTVIRRDGTRTVQILNNASRTLEKTAISPGGDLIGYVVSAPDSGGVKQLALRVAKLESEDPAFHEVAIGQYPADTEVMKLAPISPTNFAVGVGGDVVIYSYIDDAYQPRKISLPNRDVVRAIDVTDDGSRIVVAGRDSVYSIDTGNGYAVDTQKLFTDGTQISDMTVYESPLGSELCVATTSGLYRFA